MSKRIVVKVGEYQKGGETKGKYIDVGVILENDKGEFVLLDPTVNLAGVMLKQRLMNPQKSGDSVMASVFTNEPRQESKPESHGEDPNDRIPF